MTVQEAVNRGYNLLVCSIVILAGAAFGSVIVNEAELNDKLDDGILLAVGVIALVWYLWGTNRVKRSWIPILCVVLALVGQIIGVLLEKDDKEAFGDNIGGMIIYLPTLVFAIYQYVSPPKLEASQPA
jgi:hypothetical protein